MPEVYTNISGLLVGNRDNRMHGRSPSPLPFLLFIFLFPSQKLDIFSPWICKLTMDRLIPFSPALQKKVGAFVNLCCSGWAFLFHSWFCCCCCCYVGFSLKQKFLTERCDCSERQIPNVSGVCTSKLSFKFENNSKSSE